MLEKQKEWYLGLDIGSNSIGFSATDTEYTILTKNGHLQCGTRLFEGALDASIRRAFRSSRRRLARRKVRIDLLQDLFNEKIAEKDQAFFIRLNESRLHLDDKSIKVKYPLFNDKEFTDKEYYAKFPTIYHLRKHLIENDETDIRLIYLACHHLIKYRGHFLSPDFNPKRSNEGYKNIIEKINKHLTEEENFVTFETTNIAGISDIITNKRKSSKEQWVAIKDLINPNKNKSLDNIVDVIAGNKIVLSKIWDDENLKGFEKEMKAELKDFKFSSPPEKYEACYAIVEKELNDDQLGILVLLKSFHDAVECDRVLFGHEYIADAMVARYDEHKTDLKMLKDFIKKHLNNEYNKMFRLNKDYSKDSDSKKYNHASYANYVGSNITHREKSISHSSI
jgi:CRISPR-associated endonuclease Csn1